MILASILILLIILLSMLKTPEHFQIPFEFRTMHDLSVPYDISRYIELPDKFKTSAKSAPIILTDHVSYMLVPELNTQYQVIRHSDEKSYIFLMSKTKFTLTDNNIPVGILKKDDRILVDILSTCSGMRFTPVHVEDSNHMLIHSPKDYNIYKSMGYNVIDLMFLDKNVLDVVGEGVTTIEYHVESGKATLASPIVLLMKSILMENFSVTRKEVFLHDIPIKVVSLLPKTITISNQMVSKGDKVTMFNQHKKNVSGVYYVTDLVGGVATLSQAVTVDDGIVSDQIVYGNAPNNIFKDDLIFIKSLQCFAVVASVSNGEYQANLKSCVTIDANRQYFPEEFTCFGYPGIYNEDMCESVGSTMSRKCVYDSECPYFSTTLEGGCVMGVCEMPIGVSNKSYIMPEPQDVPLCHNCKDGKGDCCNLPGKKYAFYK